MTPANIPIASNSPVPVGETVLVIELACLPNQLRIGRKLARQMRFDKASPSVARAPTVPEQVIRVVE